MSVLARLILPEYYGIYGLLVLLISISTIFVIPFVNKNIILSKGQDLIIESLLVSLIHSVIICLTLFFTSSFIQAYFEEIPNFEPYLKVGIFIIPLMGLNNVLTSYFFKNLDYRWLSIRKFLVTLLANGLIPILLAYFFGMNEWALLAGLYAKEIVDILVLSKKANILKKWGTFKSKKIKAVYQNFKSITMSDLVNKVALNGDNFVISKFLGATSLGLYSKSYELMTLPIKLVNEALQSVGLSSMASESENSILQLEMIKRVYFLIGFLIFPVTYFLFYSSEFLILILFGKDWIDAGPLFKILSLGMFFRLAYKIPSIFLQLRRKFKKLFWAELLYSIMVIGFSLLALRFGVEGVAYAVVLSVAIQFLILTWIFSKEIGENSFKILKSLIPPLILIALMFSTTELLQYLLGDIAGFMEGLKLMLLSLMVVFGSYFCILSLPDKFIGNDLIWWKKQVKSKI